MLEKHAAGHWSEVMGRVYNLLKLWADEDDPMEGFVAPAGLFWKVEGFFREVELVLDCVPGASLDAYQLSMRVVGFPFDQPVVPGYRLKNLRSAERFLRGIIRTFRSTFSEDVSFLDPGYRGRVTKLTAFLGLVSRMDGLDGRVDPNSPLKRRRHPRIH